MHTSVTSLRSSIGCRGRKDSSSAVISVRVETDTARTVCWRSARGSSRCGETKVIDTPEIEIPRH